MTCTVTQSPFQEPYHPGLFGGNSLFDSFCRETLGACVSRQSPHESTNSQEKPFLPPPSKNPQSPTSFHIFLLLMALAIKTESDTSVLLRSEIKYAESESQELMKKEIDKRRERAEKEKSANRWGILGKMMSWIGSTISIITGVALCATGIGAAAGALMISGGAIQIGSQIMELSGGWDKVRDILPGDDDKQKAAVCTWIQIGISVFSIIMSGVGIIAGGGMQAFSGSGEVIMYAFNGITSGAEGVSNVGIGYCKYDINKTKAEMEQVQLLIAIVNFHREDCLKSMEDYLEYLTQNYQQMAQSMGLLEKIDSAAQPLIR